MLDDERPKTIVEKLNFTSEPDTTDELTGELVYRTDSMESTAPDDDKRTCWIIFLMYGIGVLYPWNVILSCLDFLMDEVRTFLFVT